MRMGREESPPISREQMLAAAREVFLSTGYAGATLEAVANRADDENGLVQASFANKEALFIELLSRALDDHLAGLRRVVDENRSLDALLAGLRGYLEAHGDMLDFTRAAVEFLTLQRGEGPLAQLCADLYRRQRRGFAELLRAVPQWPQSDADLADDAAAALVGMTLGLAIQRGSDPRAITPRLWARAVESYVAGLVAPKGSGPRLATTAR